MLTQAEKVNESHDEISQVVDTQKRFSTQAAAARAQIKQLDEATPGLIFDAGMQKPGAAEKLPGRLGRAIPTVIPLP